MTAAQSNLYGFLLNAAPSVFSLVTYARNGEGSAMKYLRFAFIFFALSLTLKINAQSACMQQCTQFCTDALQGALASCQAVYSHCASNTTGYPYCQSDQQECNERAYMQVNYCTSGCSISCEGQAKGPQPSDVHGVGKLETCGAHSARSRALPWSEELTRIHIDLGE